MATVSPSRLNPLLTIGLLACVAVPLFLLFSTEINWDEFYFLSKIHLVENGQAISLFQSGYIPLFSWVSAVSSHAIEQVIAARLAVWILFGATILLLYGIALDFQTKTAALFSLVCLAGFSFVLEHGVSFRADPIAVFFLALCGFLLRRAGVGSAAAAGLSLGAAFAVTIKSVLVIPALAGIWLLRFLNERAHRSLATEVARLGVVGVSAALGVLAYILLYANGTRSTAGSSDSLLRESFQRLLVEPDILPRLDYLRTAIAENPVFFILFAAGFFVLLGRALFLRGLDRLRALALLSLAVPVLSFLFYRNAYPYFYWFILAFPALIIGVGIDSLIQRAPFQHITKRRRVVLIFLALLLSLVLQYANSPYFWLPLLPIPIVLVEWGAQMISVEARVKVSSLFLGVCCVVVVSSAIINSRTHSDRTLDVQKTTLDAIYQMFPEPVPYIDRCSMVSNYPKKGFFMSTWGMDRYHERGVPDFLDLIQDEQPKFLLANHPLLDPETIWTYPPVGLFPDDVNALRENFIPHWGRIWIPGKRLDFRRDLSIEVDILIEGRYILAGASRVAIGSAMLNPGDSIVLRQGTYQVTGPVHHDNSYLRLSVPYPSFEASNQPIFSGFGSS